jgi:hypothetical protein
MTAGLVLLILAVWLVAAVVAAIIGWRPQVPARPFPLAVPARKPVRADVPHALYDYLRPNGTTRYVGISNEPPARHRRHGVDPKDQWWYRQTTRTMHIVAWYPNRDAAQAAERARVRMLAHAGHDLANDHHNPARRVRRVA